YSTFGREALSSGKLRRRRATAAILHWQCRLLLLKLRTANYSANRFMNFKRGANAWLILLLTVSYFSTTPRVVRADTTVELAVTVEDESGKRLSMAHVNVFQNVSEFRTRNFVPVPDLQGDTDVNGLARFTIRVKANGSLSFSLEVSRENMQPEYRKIDE